MKLAKSPGSHAWALLSGPRSVLSVILSFACTFSAGIDLPQPVSAAPSTKDKKLKPDAALKGLPITELTADEAILHALNPAYAWTFIAAHVSESLISCSET